MKKEDFERLVDEALESLPENFKEKLENIVVVVEENNPKSYSGIKVKSGTLILGLYQGIPLKKRGFYYGNVLPDKITIYQKPIESICKTEEEIKTRVREVVIHEIGHYFGLSEEELKVD